MRRKLQYLQYIYYPTRKIYPKIIQITRIDGISERIVLIAENNLNRNNSLINCQSNDMNNNLGQRPLHSLRNLTQGAKYSPS